MRERLKWSAGLLVSATVLMALVFPVAARPSRVASSASMSLPPAPAALTDQDAALHHAPRPASIIEIQPGTGDESTLQDAHISDGDQDSNFDPSGALQVRAFGPALHSLMQWDLGSVPPGSVIESAQLELYSFYRSASAAIEIHVYEMLVPWDESAVTWNQASAGTAWTTPGCGAGSDRASVAATSATISADAPVNVWYSWDVTSLAQDWYANPGTNHGVILVGTGGAVRHDFAASESSATDLRPKLVIQYAQSGDTPTPTQTVPSSSTPGPSSTPTPTKTHTVGPSVTPTSTPDNWIDVSQAIDAYCLGTFEGDTSGKPNNASYYGDLTWDEFGAEDVYILRKTVKSDLTVELLWQDLGLDLDVFLLSGPDPSLLLDAGDLTFTHRSLDPGTYYVVVDGYKIEHGTGGHKGAYRLSIECQGEPTPTPSPTATPVFSFYPFVIRQPTPTPTTTPTPAPTPTFVPYAFAVNCGGTEWYSYSDTFAYSPDKPYAPDPAPAWGWQGQDSGVWSTDKEIYDTLDAPVFQVHRYSMDAYRFAVPAARYEVQLHFAEVFPYARAGDRVFAVDLEGQRVLDGFDMVGQGLKFTARTEVFQVDVTDGELTIDFIPQSDSYGPAISGIRVRSIGAAS